ncbi:MFP1 attachment factor 1-like [Rutidosis leptorrhynchoides]|uniref:MFP1 attachment factor 1-like n=1 Tax=Rutidosis leptorrhynchoides TaxID=125765 RepID=UPI003A9A416A
MTDQTEEQTSIVTAGEDAGTTLEPTNNDVEVTTKKFETMSFSIWPPTQRTRDAVIKRLIETLTEKSVLSDRYGTISSDEASDVALRIEEEAFKTAPSGPLPDGEDGIEILQSYSKEISKRMLDFVKSRSASSAAAAAAASVSEDNDGVTDDAAAVVGDIPDEESSA